VSERRAAVLGVAVLVAGAVAGCAEVGTAPTSVVSLGFDTSAVAVVVGDTLRDTLGRLLPLRAAGFNAAGDTIDATAVPPAYFVAPADTGVVRLAGPLVIGGRLRDTPARVFATVGTLQSLPKSIDVIRRPTRLADTTARDTARYVAGAVSGQSAGRPQVRVSADSAGQRVGVRRVAVRFTVERAAPAVADSVLLVDERAVAVNAQTSTVTFIPRSPLDSADAGGYAGRRVLVFIRRGVTGVRDSVVLRATIAHPAVYNVPTLASEAVRVVIPVLPQGATP
jgi:hypothetical protein